MRELLKGVASAHVRGVDLIFPKQLSTSPNRNFRGRLI